MQKDDLTEALLRQLKARDAADSRIAAELMRTADLLNAEPDSSGLPVPPLDREIYISLHCYRLFLLRQIRCSQEQLWYQTEAEACLRNRKVYALSPAIREFCGQTELLTSGYAEMTVDDVPETLFSLIPPQRLIFVLLCLLTEAFSQSPAYNALRLTVSHEKDQIRIVMRFREGTDADKKTLPEPVWELGTDAGLPASPQAIIRLFEEAFQVRILRQENDEQHLYSLVFSAASPVDGLGTVESDKLSLPASPLSVYHAMLGAVIPAEELLRFDSRRL